MGPQRALVRSGRVNPTPFALLADEYKKWLKTEDGTLNQPSEKLIITYKCLGIQLTDFKLSFKLRVAF